MSAGTAEILGGVLAEKHRPLTLSRISMCQKCGKNMAFAVREFETYGGEAAAQPIRNEAQRSDVHPEATVSYTTSIASNPTARACEKPNSTQMTETPKTDN